MHCLSALRHYFTPFELLLWCASVCAITISFFFFQAENLLSLIASLIGATFLILNAKGNVAGLFLTVLFSILYGVISYRAAYYGEMITYLGMTTPISIASIVAWLRHPAQKGKAEVKVNTLVRREYPLLALLSAAVTIAFYFILDAFHTAQLMFSTLSVLTSFIASYLTMRRSPLFALAYASNDIVLICLWVIAAIYQDGSNWSVVICFVVFLINDLYGFLNWKRMKTRQNVCSDITA